METFIFNQIKAYFGTLIAFLYGLGLYVAGAIDPKIEWAFAGILMFVLGIPHGAGDHLLVKKWREAQGIPFSIVRFMFSYLGVMAVYGLIWHFFPTFAFIIFILISVFHFGDLEERESEDDHFWGIARKLSVGTGILGWILSTHVTEVNEILGDFKWKIPETWPRYLPFIFLGCMGLGFRIKEWRRFSNTFLTLIIGAFLPIIPAFVCYFAACHAMYSIGDMSAHLGISLKRLLGKLLPFSCLAFVLGFFYLQIIEKSQVVFQGFVFLSLLTLPHFWLMHQFVKKK
jgi:Brp/Blh family beta-carotene 15,15'-monooxygenase